MLLYRKVFSKPLLIKQLLPAHLSSVSVVNSQPLLTLKLPKVQEQRNFVLPGTSMRELQDMIRIEDPSVQSVNAIGNEGVVYSKSTPISFLLQNGFTLEMLDEDQTKHRVEIKAVSDCDFGVEDLREKIKALAGSLEIVENKIAIQDSLRQKLDDLHVEFNPLEHKRQELQSKSQLRTNIVVWGGLIAMGAQFGFLARLVWWEYSWDIMEPITYFVTYGTAIIMYAYFVCVKADYQFESARDRLTLRSFHKQARRHGFDTEKYNALATKKKEIEDNLTQLDVVGSLLSTKGELVAEQPNAGN